MKTIRDIRVEALTLLSSVTIDTPELVVDILLSFVLNYPSIHEMRFDLSLPFPKEYIDDFFSLVYRAQRGEPIAYIIGKKYFLDFAFLTSSATLIPRPETEELVELVLRDIDSQPTIILDIGTGSGCIACSLALYRPSSRIYAVDISLEALQIAYINACTYNITSIHFLQADLYMLPFQPNTFTHIVSNPPYLSQEEHRHLGISVKDFEPYQALVAGETGLEAIKGVLDTSYTLLQNDGLLYLEIGHLQRQEIERYVTNMGWKYCVCKEDLSHKERFLILKK